MDELLSSLPRERAAAGFTGRVLAALDQREHARGRGHRRWIVALAASAAALLLCWGGLQVVQQQQQQAIRRAELQAEILRLRLAHGQLSAELRELRKRVERQPVLYLGGDDRVDYVLDLRRLTGRELPVVREAAFGPAARGESL